MKTPIQNLPNLARLAALVLLFTLNPQLSTFAQGTAFTYQGVLSQGGAAINGSNDLTFTLYNAVSAGATVGTSNVVNDLIISNGLFTVTLDFGAGAFDGSARWLQIAGRPGASTGAYTNLVPRTPITPTPYAIYAASAATAGGVSSVAASNITGTIDDARLSANVARLNVGNTFIESQTFRTSTGGVVISSSTGGQFGSGTLRVQGNTGMGADPHPLYRLFVAGNMSASSYVGDGSQLANVEADTYLGPVADNQLSANIARRASGNTFTGNQIISSGNFGLGTATPQNLLDLAAGGLVGNSTVLGLNVHDTLNRGTKVSFGYNVPGSEFNGMRAVVNPGTALCGNSGDLLFYTWECNTAGSREVMRINGRGNVIANGNLIANVDLSVGGYVRISGNVGIGENSPGFPLNFGNVLGDKIALLNNAPGQPSFGFGVQSSLLQIHTADAGSDVAFGYGTSAALTETMRIKGNGKVGIGTASPATALHVVGSGDTELSIQSTDNNRRWTLQASGGPDGNPAFLGGYFQIIDRTAGASRLRIETNGNVTIPTELTTTAVNITSDRNAKEQFKPVNARDVLAKVVGLPISEWQYKTQSDARHIGPMAQDFREAFALGRDDKHITSVDADGVALAAIQGLNEKLEEKTQEVDALKKSVAALTELVNKLAAQQNGGAR